MATIRYRRLENGDYRFGSGAVFLVDTPEAVGQAIRTRLLLETQEWFLNLNEGTNYSGAILGMGTQGTRDLEIQERILDTPGVKSIVEYESLVDTKRRFTVRATVDTVFGSTSVEITGN